jgi:hypothetical protein
MPGANRQAISTAFATRPRIGREQHCALAVHQAAHIVAAGAVAAEQPVIAEDPQIARA